jgi:hypothetical protein
MQLRMGRAVARAVIDYYRCPEPFLDVSINEDIANPAGFFRFGADILYGRCSRGYSKSQLQGDLYDVSQDLVLDKPRVSLPFDPTEVVDNLRLERYASSQESGVRTLAKRSYYSLRPIVPFLLRKQLQKFHLRNWRELSFPSWPIDCTVESICEKVLFLALKASGADRIPFVWFWPEGATSSLLMTHDVETKVGKEFCSELMDIDDLFGIKASFQIIPEGRYSVSMPFLAGIRQRGFEIAVHGLRHDGLLFEERNKFLPRARAINEYARKFGARGFRAAVLCRRPNWYGAFDFSFDMSIPNTAHLDPQRGGCCTIMPYFIGRILELPVTTTQDYMLFHLLGERSIDLWKRQIDLILDKNGMISFVVHPDYVLHEQLKSLYKQLLTYLQEVQLTRGLWVTLPSAMDEWWRARSEMQIVPNGYGWRIEGQGAERAVVAYARNVDGKMVYELEPRST